MNRRTILTLPLAAPLAHRGKAEPAPEQGARIPDDPPLHAVKWTGGFWRGCLRRLRERQLPGVLDGSFLSPLNGASLLNFLRAAGVEEGGAVGRFWSDGDCYFALDAAARLYAHQPDAYLRGKLGYWPAMIAKLQREDGLVDTWTTLKRFDPATAAVWDRFERSRRAQQATFQGGIAYNLAHLYVCAVSHERATGEGRLMEVADKALTHFLEETVKPDGTARGYGGGAPMAFAYALRYWRTGEPGVLAALQRSFASTRTIFGPPLRQAGEIFGHGTQTSNFLRAATMLAGITGEASLRQALERLAANLLERKIYLTGAVAPVMTGRRPDLLVNGVAYPGDRIMEAVGEEFDLPNDRSYCESCANSLYMEWMYRMFRLTGEAVYMDAVERALLNGVLGCVDLDQASFFYANPQEQLPGAKRHEGSGPNFGNDTHYTYKRVHVQTCACCPPKVMRAIAMSVEMACSVNSEGLWMNLYGDNRVNLTVPGAGAVGFVQTSDYPWDGRVRLRFSRVENAAEFDLRLRIPAWVERPASVFVNGKKADGVGEPGSYFAIRRKWKAGDSVEFELPMPVRLMAAHPRIVGNRDKVAVVRGPVVYCVEQDDLPEGVGIESLRVPASVRLQPESASELGGISKLTGTLVAGNQTTAGSKLVYDEFGASLYREARYSVGRRAGRAGRAVPVSLIPYYARLNRKGEYFRVWLPVE